MMNSATLRRMLALGAWALLPVGVAGAQASLPAVAIDKHKVLQILVNLITTARQAMKDCPEKTLTLGIRATPEGTARVSICDTGCGIAAENMTRVFAHGFTTKKDGHGFGLHSSALAAKEMGGALSAASEGPGHGATFTLDLPLEPPTL